MVTVDLSNPRIFIPACKAHGLPEPVAEFRFHKREWRFDFAFTEAKIAVEFEGGVWTQGRHTRPGGFLRDMEKYNEAAILGWRVLRVATHAPDHVFDLVKRAIAAQ